ncbi:MAG: hypothetical protein KME45_19555 [Stenomitos rutilans HA7619-LM2]|jgi:hypothetical protein|nr:hypothetical protein [Stenomitos rutilans HA7619-LM2]
MTRIFNFDDELQESGKQILNIHSDLAEIRKEQRRDTDELENLASELREIYSKVGLSPEFNNNLSPQKPNDLSTFTWDDQLFLTHNPLVAEARIKAEIFRNPELLPPLSGLDYAIVGISGLAACIIDFLIVRIPKDINYLGKFRQEGSSFTGWLRTLGTDDKNQLNPFLKWCEQVCKVPYDQSVNSNIQGFSPKTHRLLSLGHDPLFGLIFGILDILNGSITAFGTNGSLQIIKTFDPSLTDKVFSPLIWIGHIVSDVCTKMGIPIPGWAFLQILQFGSFGEKGRSIAEISKWMYLNGYDIRHLVTMSIPVAVIEIIVRSYHYLSLVDSPDKLQGSIHSSIATQEIARIESNLKLHKMLFLAHAVAASGNALKVFAYGGNPLAINLPQWIFFLKESIKIAQTVSRDKTPEKLIHNRKKIDTEWDEIRSIQIGRLSALDTNSSTYFDYFRTASQ